MRVVTDEGAMRAAMLPTLTATSMRVATAGKLGASRRSRVDPKTTTNKLRDSFKAWPKGIGGAAWGTANDHFSYNEWGTYKMSAQPMLRPSVNDARAALG